jgi:hypothetical protein
MCAQKLRRNCVDTIYFYDSTFWFTYLSFIELWMIKDRHLLPFTNFYLCCGILIIFTKACSSHGIMLQMQTILYHNSSGPDAFTGNLKQKEVHRAITLHPVKQHRHMYRVHNYMKVNRSFFFCNCQLKFLYCLHEWFSTSAVTIVLQTNT